MENQYLDQDVNKGEEGLSSQDMGYLLTAGKWARFMGIVTFVMTGFIVLGAIGLLTMGSALGSAFGESGLGAGFGFGIAIAYLLLAAPFFFMGLFMSRFGTRVKEGQYSGGTASMTDAFKNLKNYFQLIGILTAIFIGIYVLAILGMIVSAAAFR
jgi:Family of unknown function (DUF5362)